MADDRHPWLASYPKNIRWDAEIPEGPLFAILDESVRRFPTHESMDFLGRTWSYAELGAMVDRAAAGFRKLGVEKGVKVGLFLPNCPQFVVAYFGILKAGGTVVNYSPLYSEEELAYQIEDSETDIMVTLGLAALYPKMAALLARTRIRKLVVGQLQDVLSFPKNLLFPLLKRSEIAKVPDDGDHVPFRRLLDNDGGHEPPEIDPREDIAVFQYTGGTTGVPKGAMLSHANLHANIHQALQWNPTLEPGRERMMGVLPFFHVFAMTVVMNFTIAIGGSIVMRPRFELDPVLQDITKKKPTLFPGVPTMYTAIVNHPKPGSFDLTSIKTCMSGGAPLPVEIKRRFEELSGCKLVEGYGLTESAPIAASNPFEGVNKESSVGMPVPGTTITIVDKEDPPENPAAGRGRRDLHLGPAGDEGLLAPGGRDGRGHCRGPAAHGRCRAPGRGRLCVHHRPQEGPRAGERLQRLPAQCRGSDLSPSRRRGGHRHRHSGRLYRRGGEGVRQARRGRRRWRPRSCSPSSGTSSAATRPRNISSSATSCPRR